MMVVIFEQAAMAILLLVQNGCTIPVEEKGKAFKYEEYVIEHEISSGQAKNSVMSTSLNSIAAPPGCHECTPEEKHYCLGSDLINDHCCCDYRHHEVLPFIPHTCYLGTQLCTPIISSCDEYHRLRTCCCQKYAFLKWRAKSSKSTSVTTKNGTPLLVMFAIYYFVHR